MVCNAEQTEHLKAMHEKFKEEICQYLHDCQGAMEGMKEYHFELQGAIKKQSMTTLSFVFTEFLAYLSLSLKYLLLLPTSVFFNHIISF